MMGRLDIVILLACGIALGQTPSIPAPGASGASHAFEVASIRPSKPGGSWRITWATTPDGYRAIDQRLRSTILIAYFPQGMAYWSKDRIVGAPAWIDDFYDIDARVSEADEAEWQKQGLTLDKKPMLQQMLQALLADRCKLLVHRIPAQIQGFALELGKHGPKLDEMQLGETPPKGVLLADGGVLVPYSRGERAQVHFYGTTMRAFAQHLSNMSAGRPVQDKTGLIGRYDFVLSWQDVDPDHPEREGWVSSDDPNPLSHWDLDSLGLKLVPIKIPTETLVIDHIERPSEN